MEKIKYKPTGVCSRSIDITVDDGMITDCVFTGGCSGNTQGLSALIKGMAVDEAISRLSGIKCGFRSTSCPDQLAKALIEYKSNLQQNDEQ